MYVCMHINVAHYLRYYLRTHASTNLRLPLTGFAAAKYCRYFVSVIYDHSSRKAVTILLVVAFISSVTLRLGIDFQQALSVIHNS